MKYTFLLFCMFFSALSFAQSDTLNCVCPPKVIPLTPEKCPPVRADYGTSQTVSIRYWVRCELLTYCPTSRPEGFSAYNIATTENKDKFPGYWVVGYGWYETMEEAEEMAKNIRTDWPEFCNAFAATVPVYSKRIKYDAVNVNFKNVK